MSLDHVASIAWRSRLAVLVVALTLMLAGPPAVYGGPNTPVSSDGSVFESSVDLAGSGIRGESSFRGAGKVSDAAAEFSAAESMAELKALLALPPATGPNGQESIIGPDTRVRITPTTTYPARAVVLITFTGGRCTGWLYGRDIVATAGHCVHGGPGSTWKTNVRVYPGRDGTTAPYGSCTARRLHSVNGWTNSGSEIHDYGAIKLNCTIGNTTGWFGYWWQSATLTGLPTRISGYPGDKPLTQWRSIDSVRITQTRQIFYFNDTVGGMSGSPVYNQRTAGSPFCTGQCAMAIHTQGLHGSSPHSTHNHATRIVEPVFTNLFNWKAAP